MTDELILEWFIRWGDRWVDFYEANTNISFIFSDAAADGWLHYGENELRLTDKAIRRIQNETG